jgi:hypothetical protein
MKTNAHFVHIALREMFQTNVVEKTKTHILCPVIFLNFAVYEIMKYLVEVGRPQLTIWRMCIACWIPKARNTLRICNTYCFAIATAVEQMRLNITS